MRSNWRLQNHINNMAKRCLTNCANAKDKEVKNSKDDHMEDRKLSSCPQIIAVTRNLLEKGDFFEVKEGCFQTR